MIQVHTQLRTSCNGNAKGFLELSIVVVALILFPTLLQVLQKVLNDRAIPLSYGKD